MNIKNLKAAILLILFIGYNTSVFAQVYPDYAYEFLGADKHEKFNRKMFNFDRGLNKYFIRPIHIIWASILPQYAMDRIFGISNNIEYPIRLVSSLVQKDFHNAGNETKRFFVNTTIGLAGMFDPAKHLLKIERSRDNMDKAFARRNIKSGTYFVAPVIVFTTVRGLFGRLFDMALNPSTYIGTPLLAVIKAGIAINRTSYIQTLVYLVESSYVDPYEITKKAFGINEFIKKNNYDRVEVLSQLKTNEITNPVEENEKQFVRVNRKKSKQAQLSVSAKLLKNGKMYNSEMKGVIVSQLGLENVSLKPDIYLNDYNPQRPIIDSMRTTLFNVPDFDKSIWNEMSPWNKSFMKRIKTGSINIAQGRDDYEFKYMLQKDKHSPLAIIYPSTGDGVKSDHPLKFAKIFYDAGYSVIVHGNPFQWEYVKSMPEEYRPGLPTRDAQAMRKSTLKIVNKLKKKYGYDFSVKVVFGTSLGALDVLFMAAQESKDNTLGKTQFIALCPPIDLIYALNQVDDITDAWRECGDDLKQRVALASAKVVKLYQSQDDIDFMVNNLPFDEEEAKLITGFSMHQRLSDVVFVLEKAPINKPSNIYNLVYSMNYNDYMKKYIMVDNKAIQNELNFGFGLVAISDYLENSDNYKIYHTTNDYLINKNQLKFLKLVAGKKLVILNNGSHLGFTYRPEFIEDLKKTLAEYKQSL